jgi:hypothetical protein
MQDVTAFTKFVNFLQLFCWCKMDFYICYEFIRTQSFNHKSKP